MRPRLGSLLLAAAVLLAGRGAAADSSASHFYVTPFGAYILYDDDLKYPGPNDLKDNLYGGLRIGYQFHPWFAFEAAGGYSPTEVDSVDNAPKAKFMHASGNFVFTPWINPKGGPFFSVGFGAGRIKPEDASETEELNQGLAEGAAGLMWNFTDLIGIRAEARGMWWIPKEDIDKTHVKYMVFGGGVTFNFGGGPPADSDNDGVPDRKDKCPDTPLGARVDENGCPIDSDADAVPDGIDQCPNTPAGCRVDARGCPIDSDGDGVCDGIDACEGTPRGAKVDARGCPTDSDNDGVPDGIDQCPDTPAGVAVDARGCPADSDNDGVPDDKDQCPNTPAGLRVDANGCPIEVIERETELMDTGMIRLQNIHFETAKWDILPDEMPRLDIVGQVLTRWPELKIEIGGHCDARGSRAYNQRLSENRARSVRDYLLGKFPALKPDQYTVRGYGEDRPIAPNNGEPNWGKNRRVEFVVMNKDVLKREVQRRRLLQKNESAPADTTR